MTDPEGDWWTTVYLKENQNKKLTWTTPGRKVGHTSLIARLCNNASECGNTTEASNHNVSWSNIMACLHDTQTRPEFTYLFLGTPSDLPASTPVVLRAEADTEELARAHFPYWDLVFAAQIRTKAPCRLQLFDAEDHFLWFFEQRFDACTSGAQEVAHV
ncbi:host cell division inhibitor Icd-like protein [Yokenella regensburgei]|nr:host cell division inhibitor Icd-like protein [Yokenella regensburgei]